ncbi:MAG: hypothetical protein J1F23_05260 [Oscillospiraceae bacterium]|nr:hypothetical protein [Oscillospiraceae bacterium]
MTYRIFAHTTDIQEKRIDTYGISVISDGKEKKRLFDVSTDLKALKKLVARLNAGDVELVHLNDILDDFYTEHC